MRVAGGLPQLTDAHDRDDETFFVLDGELRVFTGEEEHTAGPGTVAVLPRRLRHAYAVTSATARFLTLPAPVGFERCAAEAGEPLRALTPPPPPAGPPDFAAPLLGLGTLLRTR